MSVKLLGFEDATAYHGTLDTVVMPAVGIGEDTVLVLQASIAPNRNIRCCSRQRAAGVSELGAEWASNG